MATQREVVAKGRRRAYAGAGVAPTRRGAVGVVAPKSRSFAPEVGAIPDEALVPLALAWAVASTTLVVPTPLYSWIATLRLPALARLAVTVKGVPPVTLAAYQMLSGWVPPEAGAGSSTALL